MLKMEGIVERLLTNSTGEVNGIVLDNGRVISFRPEKAIEVLSIVNVGSRVEIQTLIPGDGSDNNQSNVVVVVNLSSNESFTLCVLGPTCAPEVCADYPPPESVSTPLAPFLERRLGVSGKRFRTTERVSDEIERAYDQLHRSHVILAFLKTANHERAAVLAYLQEAERVYVQTLGRYQARDFEGARECATASYHLSRMVEILVSRAFHSAARRDDSAGANVSSSPAAEDNRVETRSSLRRVERQLGRIQWVIKNGTLPSDDRDQVQKLVSWSENLRGWACRLLDLGAGQEADEFASAAQAAVDAAEHVCRKCYVTRYDSRVSAAAV
jgi:hypothetical protein